MLRKAYEKGTQAALARFGIKEAAGLPGAAAIGKGAASWLGGAARSMVGHPEKMFNAQQYKPGGMFHWKNVLWPSEKGAPISNWLGRGFGTLLPAYGVYKTLQGEQGDPNKGKMENTLGSAGNALGFAFGFPAAGILGAPVMGRLGQSLGESVGRFVDGAPKPPPQQPQQPPGQYPQGGF